MNKHEAEEAPGWRGGALAQQLVRNVSLPEDRYRERLARRTWRRCNRR